MTTSRKRRSWIWKAMPVFLVLALFLIGYGSWKFWQREQRPELPRENVHIDLPTSRLQLAKRNYGQTVKSLSKQYGLPYDFLMSLIVLESSGHKPAGSRFESHVYKRLLQLQAGERSKYEDVTTSMVADADEDALKNLATSWGPFQLMGYKCVGLGANVADLRDDRSIEWSLKWIRKEYGWLLKSGRFRDAFHYHNTGKVYPRIGKSRTHDPLYVEKGLAYMEYFREH